MKQINMTTQGQLNLRFELQVALNVLIRTINEVLI